MKKIFAVLFCIVFSVSFSLCGCQSNEDEIRIFVPDGAPLLAVADILETDKLAGTPFTVTVSNGENCKNATLSGEADVVVLPTNTCAILYNNGAKYKLLSANVFGLFYLVGNSEITSLDSLVGKVVCSIGKNSTTEFVFKKILTYYGIQYVDSDVAVSNKVAIRYFGQGSEIIPLMKSGVAEFAILGEPAVSKLLSVSPLTKELFDLQSLWQECFNLEGYPQAGVFVSDKLVENNPLFVDALFAKLCENEEFLQQNSPRIANLLAEHGSVDLANATFDQNVLLRCNISCVKSVDCKNSIEQYFNAIYSLSPNAIGGKLPDDGFYLVL